MLLKDPPLRLPQRPRVIASPSKLCDMCRYFTLLVSAGSAGQFALGTACWVLLCTAAPAQLLRDEPADIQNVGIEERPGELIPLETTFRSSEGRRVSLNRLFDGTRPVILSFNYTDCPMLCKLQLSGLVDALKEVSWTAGEEFRVVSISIDPSETPEQANVARQRHLQAYGRPGSRDGWHFLVGAQDAIQRVTRATGFQYEYMRDQGEFSHAAAIIICTPEGAISRYLYGVQFDPETVRLSLAEAADGRVGSPLDQLILYCFRYDSDQGAYAPAARNLMRVGAAGTVLILGLLIVPFWLRSRHADSTHSRAWSIAARSDHVEPAAPEPQAGAS